MEKPHSPYLMMIAVGKYKIEERKFEQLKAMKDSGLPLTDKQEQELGRISIILWGWIDNVKQLS